MIDDPDEEDFGPSKSARKRAAHAAQELGERLIGLREAELAAVPLPENVLEAVHEARRLTSRAALSRQRQYIGKLMRGVDPEPIVAALEASSRTHTIDVEHEKRVERWRRRLLEEGEAALEALAELCPSLDRDRLAALVGEARAPTAAPATRTKAARALFRELRPLLANRAPAP